MDDADRQRLDREAYFSLETFRKSGVAVATPVWFAEGDGRFWVFTEARSGKMKRLRNDPRVRVTPCNVRGRTHGDVAWQGTARRVDDPDRVAAAYRFLHRKYGWQMKVTDLLSRLFGRIEGRAILEIELTSPAD